MKKVKVEQKDKKTKGNIKSYLRDFLLFVDKNILKTTGILVVVAIFIVALTVQPLLKDTLTIACEGACRDGITLLSEYGLKLQVLLITGVAGVVPYIYAPILGFVGYIINEVSGFTFIIKGYGYSLGTILGILPLILNILTICIVTALGIYMCRTLTVGYKIASLRNMNFTNFRIKLYEVLQNEEKVKKLTEKKEAKIEKLQITRGKLNYLQILNVSIFACILQFISVLIQQILV